MTNLIIQGTALRHAFLKVEPNLECALNVSAQRNLCLIETIVTNRLSISFIMTTIAT